VNDVTKANPVTVKSVFTPKSVNELSQFIKQTPDPIAVGGGRFSMGGQTASPNCIHLDIRELNQVIDFSPAKKFVRVQAGIRWCDLQHFLNPHGFSVKIMQTYANFTVGGSLSVNCHGRYIGLGPVILSVQKIKVILADGSSKDATPTDNSELFYGAVGGYGGLGVIAEVELDVVENVRISRKSVKLPLRKYLQFFKDSVRNSKEAIFHNGDLYPPHYQRLNAVTWTQTDETATTSDQLQPIKKIYPIHRYFFWAFSETPFGKWRREHIIDPLIFFRKKIHWRNYEAGYDASELEPASREKTTYVLQEYFIPVDRLEEFVPKMSEVFNRHKVNVINVSIRHSLKDPGSLLAWAREEVFAFVVYYKQSIDNVARNNVAVWTRELIDASLSCGGTYYLPYQAHATADQFHKAYPHAKELFTLKKKLDPDFKFRNVLFDTYYAPTLKPISPTNVGDSKFLKVISNTFLDDGLFFFLQNIYHLYPEDKFHFLIKEICSQHRTDEAIYREIQKRLPEIKAPVSDITYALPALKKQKQEMAMQTLKLLSGKKAINGYVEIGSTGRYVGGMQKGLQLQGDIYLINDLPPSNSLGDIFERGQLAKFGKFVPLSNYQPIPVSLISDNSVDLVTCYIGIHHIPLDLLDGFVRSIWRILRPGGQFILRDHDAHSQDMKIFVSLIHTVFNAGLNVPWETNKNELRFFRSIAEWVEYLGERGFEDSGERLLQANDPSLNVLMIFTKKGQVGR
jgi:FAD/FMN-containing dehydrogenase